MKLPNIQKMQEVHREEDPLRYYKTPLLNKFYFMRLKETINLLGSAHYPKLLDIGFGSGMLLPELEKHTSHLVGIDIHDKPHIVQDLVKRENITADLSRADLRHLPFESGTFDAIICVAVLDHLNPVLEAVQEMARVMKRRGVFILGNVIKNKFTDAAFACIGAHTHIHHVSTLDDIVGALDSTLYHRESFHFPFWLPHKLGLYYWAKYKKE